MKIAFVTTNLRGGGAEKAVVNLASLLAERGHEVHVILLERVIEHAIAAGFSVHALTEPGSTLSKGVLGKYLAAWRLRQLVGKLSRGAGFQLIVSTLPFADEVVSLSGIGPVWHRIANTLSSEVAILKERRPGKAQRRYRRYRRLYNGARIIAVSQGVADDLRDYFKLDRAQIEQIYNPFDLEGIAALAAQAEPELPDYPYLIHVGRFARQKRHDLLFEAWKEVEAPGHKLVLLTKPDPKLQALIEEHGVQDRVVVAGFRKNPYPWIKHARLLVLCSDHEGMPNVLVEALACGTPVVSTDCPSGPRELLGASGSGKLVPTGDVEALKGAIEAALNAPAAPTMADLSSFEANRVAARYETLPQAGGTGQKGSICAAS